MSLNIHLFVAIFTFVFQNWVAGDPLTTFTFSKCKIHEPLDTFGNVSNIQECQQHCQNNLQCGFFALNKALHICDLFTENGDSFIRDCLEVGGPKSIDYNSWIMDTNKCKVRLHNQQIELYFNF